MNYQVLARKWRPRSFAALAGQEHVVRALINALEQQRLHHAYLFTGTRGVGKTTLARIFAKCLNCETGITANPCDQCNACQEIDAGRFVDLIEVDAASRTKVEDTRDLLDNVQYAPSKGRYKVYLIDEVHMLSGHSFNALLKTLEEPPPHVKFLLATTDPQKLPVTVLSRCLQFHLKNMTPEQISAYLQQVLQAENIPFEIDALKLLARAANGSMRDSLSLLDQAIAYSKAQINTNDIKAMLGTIEETYLFELMNALMANNAAAILTTINNMAEQATDFAQALEELLTLLHQIAVLHAVPNATIENWKNAAEIPAIAKKLTAEELQLYYQIALIGRRDLPLAPSAKIGFEMVLLRMLSFRPIPIKFDLETTANIIKPAAPIAPAANVATKPALVQQETLSNKAPAANMISNEWTDLIAKLNLTGPTKAFALHCALIKLTESEADLLVDPSQATFLNDKQKERLTAAFTQYFQRPFKVTIQVGQADNRSPAMQEKQQQQEKRAIANQAIQQDQNVQAILQTFNATILPEKE